MAQFFRRRPRIQQGIEGQGRQGGCMGAGYAQVLHQQVADHRLGSGQGIDTGAVAVGGKGVAAGIVGEAGHHGDGSCPGGHQFFASP